MQTQRKRTTPAQLRRSAWLVACFAVFVAGYSVYVDMDYSRLRENGRAVDATIVQIDVIRAARARYYELHYIFELDGQLYRFDNKGDREKLEELYTATWNSFDPPDPLLAVGKTFGLLVDPKNPARHRPDRDKLQHPWLLWLRTGLALGFLSLLSGFLFAWSKREASSVTLQSRVSSSREGGVTNVEVELDLPFPDSSPQAASADALRARLEQARVAAPQVPRAGGEIRVVWVSLLLRATADSEVSEAFVELVGSDGTREQSKTLTRNLRLPAGQSERLRAELTPTTTAPRLRIAVVLSGSRRWQHELEL